MHKHINSAYGLPIRILARNLWCVRMTPEDGVERQPRSCQFTSFVSVAKNILPEEVKPALSLADELKTLANKLYIPKVGFDHKKVRVLFVSRDVW